MCRICGRDHQPNHALQGDPCRGWAECPHRAVQIAPHGASQNCADSGEPRQAANPTRNAHNPGGQQHGGPARMTQLLERSEAHGKGAGSGHHTLTRMSRAQTDGERNRDRGHAEQSRARVKFRPVKDQRVLCQAAPHVLRASLTFTMTTRSEFVTGFQGFFLEVDCFHNLGGSGSRWATDRDFSVLFPRGECGVVITVRPNFPRLVWLRAGLGRL